MTEHSWKAKAATKVASTRAKIPPEWLLSEAELEKATKQRDLTGPFIEQFLNAEDLDIIQHDSTFIVAKIKAGEWSAKRVTLAFCKTASIAYQINNCLHEIFFDQAIARAEELDQHYKTLGTTVGPLHGLPISLKDQFHVKGNDTSMGYIGWLGTYDGNKDERLVHKVNSQVVSELLKLGAILYCKTSLPQTLLFGETANNLIGRTLNPNNQNLSCGGSSGGEGALQALRGSSVGLGTDIGGSVRIPAAYNGIFALKPTHTRLSYRNVSNVLAFLLADGGHDIHHQLDLSGEPLIPQLRKTFTLKEPMSLLTYQELTIEGRDYEAAYSDYWNSTADEDGQLVDAVIMPVAPHAAVIPGKYYHTAYTEVINLMDYSVIVLPVTKADKTIDKAEPNYKPLNEEDQLNWNAYDPEIYDGAPVGIQLVGRKFEEEKIWAVGKVVHQILKSVGVK